jgi:hypothetical protein
MKKNKIKYDFIMIIVITIMNNSSNKKNNGYSVILEDDFSFSGSSFT